MNKKSDSDFFFDTFPGKVIKSRRFPDKFSGRDMRIASQMIASPEEVRFTTNLSEVEIRLTPAGKQQIKATFFEDDRSIQRLVIQRYKKLGNDFFPDRRDHFSFRADEITTLKKFLATIETVDVNDPHKEHINERDLDELILGNLEA